MPVHAKLNKARVKFHSMKLEKSGHNKFAGYRYFELADFLLPALHIFDEIGLCATTSFTNDFATMHIVDIEDGSQIIINSPMGSAELKGCHEIQNIGACETYSTRYLWTAALCIVEHDALDATTGNADAAPAPAKPITRKQHEELTTLIADTNTDLRLICQYYKVESMADLPADKFAGAKKMLEKKL